MVLIIIVCVYIVFLLIDFLPLIKEKKWKELVIFSVVFFSSLLISILLIQGVKIPSPAKPIEEIVTAIFGKD